MQRRTLLSSMTASLALPTATAHAAGSIIDIFRLAALNHRVDVFGGVLSEECGALLQQFFAARR